MGEGLKRALAAARVTRANTLAWHRECLTNATAHVYGLRRDVERRIAELARSESEIAFYAEQIAAAEKQGKSAFDRERFLAKRKTK